MHRNRIQLQTFLGYSCFIKNNASLLFPWWCVVVKSSGSLFVPIFPSLSLPHSLLFIPGPRSDIWEAEGGELFHSEGGGQAGDAY